MLTGAWVFCTMGRDEEMTAAAADVIRASRVAAWYREVEGLIVAARQVNVMFIHSTTSRKLDQASIE